VVRENLPNLSSHRPAWENKSCMNKFSVFGWDEHSILLIEYFLWRIVCSTLYSATNRK